MKKLLFAAIFLLAVTGITCLNAESRGSFQPTNVDTLRLDGPEKSFSNHTESTTGKRTEEPAMMGVKFGLSSKGMLTINASEPLDSIKVTDADGNSVKDFGIGGEKDVELDLNTMPLGHLTFLLKGKSGAENTLQVEN